jgi:outer membrane protein TolC
MRTSKVNLDLPVQHPSCFAHGKVRMKRVKLKAWWLVLALVAPMLHGQQSTIGNSTLQDIQQSLAPNPLQGSVPQGKVTDTVVQLTLRDAIQQALRYNLGLIESNVTNQEVRAQQIRQLANLMPNLNASVSESVQKIALAALGFTPGIFPGVPATLGPFYVFDARATLSQNVFNYEVLQRYRSSKEDTKGSQEGQHNTRELVVLATGNAYLVVNTALSRVEAAEVEVKTAQALYQRALDQQNAGVAPQIDALRARVELQTRQQQLINAQNDYEKSRLQLARTIGLPLGQRFEIADRVPFQPLPQLDFAEELQRAYLRRPDFLQAQSRVRSAELSMSAARGERYPSLGINGFFGDQGLNSPTHSWGVYSAAIGIQIPIFQGGRIRADEESASAALTQAKAQRDDLRARVEYEVRTAFLDIQAAAKSVEVAQTNLQYANQVLLQAQDRFSAGVADNLEVVQAQDSVATANEAFISAVYEHNISKVFLARSVGVAEQAVADYLKGTGK